MCISKNRKAVFANGSLARLWYHRESDKNGISNGKAIVYHNPMLAKWSEFEYAVIRDFELEGFPV